MEWIKVEDRLPENQQDILFLSKDEVYIATWWDNSNVVNGNRSGCYDEDVKKSNITHWMPLPSPPKQ